MTLQTSKLINQLNDAGVKFYMDETGQVRLNVPDPVPLEARPLLVELKRQKAKVAEFFQWDEPKALAMFQAAVARVRQRYIADAWPWAAEHRPELRQAVKDAEFLFNEAYQGQNMAGCRRAVAEYEQAFDALIKAHNQQRQLPADEVISLFGCDRVWTLPESKAEELDAVFAKEGIRWE